MAALTTHHATASSSAADLRDQEAVAANSSAVDLSEVAISSLDIPHKLTSDRVRRRSELARAQIPSTPASLVHEEIELPVISEVASRATASTSRVGAQAPSAFSSSVLVPNEGLYRIEGPLDDVEVPPSFPTSLAPSVRFEDETGSAVSLSPAQHAVNRRRSLLNFVTLCIAIFFEGWNDGTTGPLLPRIQEFYHVSAPSDG